MPKSPINTILVVDDNLGARRSIEALLTQDSYRFLLADSGATALELLEDNTPDIILLDVMMPGMNGFEVCQKIRADQRISEIPIIMITALDDEESMIQGIDAGADDFLSKPISKIELRSRIRSILRLNRFRKLFDERQKFELVVAQSQLGYVLIDDEDRIIFANTAAREMLDFDFPQSSQESFYDIARRQHIIQPDDIETLAANAKSIGSIEPFLLVRSSQIDVDARWIRVAFQELGLDQGSQRLLRLEDISERIVSFQEKQTFSRMISHKLLTPLNAIKAAHQLIEGSQTSRDRLAQISEIQRKGIARLEYDVRSILSFLETENGKDHKVTICQTETQIGQIADSVPFSFELKPEHNFPAGTSINLSAYAFEACTREVVENAIKFHKGDSVTINCIIRRSDDDLFVEYVFQNNSHPLTEAELANAWKPYWQADRYLTGEISGMGLGLSLIATNVWTAGGACKIENCPIARGVQLTLKFPIITA